MNEELERRVEEALRRRNAIPPLAEQLRIRAQALELVRDVSEVSDEDRKINEREEMRYRDLAERADRGERVEWPSSPDVTWRAVAAPTDMDRVVRFIAGFEFGVGRAHALRRLRSVWSTGAHQRSEGRPLHRRVPARLVASHAS